MDCFVEKEKSQKIDETNKQEADLSQEDRIQSTDNPNLDDMTIDELLKLEKDADKQIEQTEAEIERKKVLERVKRKIELAKQKEAELQELRQDRSKKPQQLGQDIELH